MPSFHVKVVEGGKIASPAALRRKHGFEVGKTLVVDDVDGKVTIRSLDDAVAAVQAIMSRVAPPDRMLSDELIAEWRAEAAREWALRSGYIRSPLPDPRRTRRGGRESGPARKHDQRGEPGRGHRQDGRSGYGLDVDQRGA